MFKRTVFLVGPCSVRYCNESIETTVRRSSSFIWWHYLHYWLSFLWIWVHNVAFSWRRIFQNQQDCFLFIQNITYLYVRNKLNKTYMLNILTPWYFSFAQSLILKKRTFKMLRCFKFINISLTLKITSSLRSRICMSIRLRD